MTAIPNGKAWLATDDSRHVALFMNLGTGPLPRKVIEADAATLARLHALEEVGVADRNVTTAGDFGDLGRRGLYVLAWGGDKPAHAILPNVYEVLVVPSYALSESQLPEDLSLIAQANAVAMTNFPASLEEGLALPA